MSEIKPRREFDEPLRPEEGPTLRATQAFDEAQAFVQAVEDETLAADAPERVVENALKPRRSLWRRMVVAGLGLFGVSVVAQGVQWAANAWYTRDWIALGGCVAGGLIVAAGVG
ncbi:TIGR01620 family protein, partial [Cronobacter sakazakii]